MCTARPFTLATVRDRTPGGSVELPYGGRVPVPGRTPAGRATPCASAIPPIAATDAVVRKPRRDRLPPGLTDDVSLSPFGLDGSDMSHLLRSGVRPPCDRPCTS